MLADRKKSLRESNGNLDVMSVSPEHRWPIPPGIISFVTRFSLIKPSPYAMVKSEVDLWMASYISILCFQMRCPINEIGANQAEIERWNDSA